MLGAVYPVQLTVLAITLVMDVRGWPFRRGSNSACVAPWSALKPFLITVAVLSAATVSIVSSQRAASSVRNLQLDEGTFRVVQVLDDGDLLVKAEQQNANARSACFRFRLAGIRIEDGGHFDARHRLRRLLDGRRLKLRFDRQRYLRGNVVVGYLFVDRQFVNLELVRFGLAEPQMLEGNSASLQNQIRQAHRTRLAALDDSPLH